MANDNFKLNDIHDDLAFVGRVRANDKSAVAFFLEKYSKPLLEYIGRNILRMPPLPVYNPTTGKATELERFDEYSYGIGCYGMYYEFIAAKFPGAGKLPQWDKLSYYAEDPKSRLYTYLSVITVRHFLKHHPDREKTTGGDEDSYYDDNERLYLMLCLKLQDRDEDTVFSEEMYQELEMARAMLKPRDAKIIELACLTDLPTMEIARQMRDEFENDPSDMSRKDLQTRISQWKNRAIVRLTGIITADRNKHLFPCLLEYAKNRKF